MVGALSYIFRVAIFHRLGRSYVGSIVWLETLDHVQNMFVRAGGHIGFDKVLWEARKVMDSNGPSVQFTYRSHDGDQGIHM